MNFTEKVKCPLCGGENAVTVRTNKDIVKCDECELVYLRTRPTVAELEIHYQRYASNPGSHMALPKTISEIMNTGLRRPDIMKDVLEFTDSPRGRFLDIGSGWGAFLLHARQNGFQVNGVEICREMADFAYNILGIYTHTKQLETFQISPGSLQAVSLLHSLEHLPNLNTALSWIHDALKVGGLICGIVPNFDSWGSNAMRENWPWLDPEMHYQHFTTVTLQKVLWQHGFNIQKMYTATGDFDRRLLPQFQPALTKLEQDMKGEELRFFATRM